jgi:hypothetical protein
MGAERERRRQRDGVRGTGGRTDGDGQTDRWTGGQRRSPQQTCFPLSRAAYMHTLALSRLLTSARCARRCRAAARSTRRSPNAPAATAADAHAQNQSPHLPPHPAPPTPPRPPRPRPTPPHSTESPRFFGLPRSAGGPGEWPGGRAGCTRLDSQKKGSTALLRPGPSRFSIKREC